MVQCMVLLSLQLVCLAFCATTQQQQTTTKTTTTETTAQPINSQLNLGHLEELSNSIHGNLPSSTTVAPPPTREHSADNKAESADRSASSAAPLSARPRKERSIDLDSADNVLDFLVDEGRSLRDYDEQHYIPNKEYREAVSNQKEGGAYLSLWPSSSQRRVAASGSIDSGAVKRVVPSRYDEYQHQEDVQLEAGLGSRRAELGSRGAGRRPQVKSEIIDVEGDEKLYGSKQLSWQLKPQVGKRIPGDGNVSPEGGGGEKNNARYLEAALQAVETDNKKMMLMRQHRAGRMYDVPQIECPNSPDHTERFACPRPDRRGRFRCIDDRSLCDGFYDCPGKEDESPEHCLFYKTTKAHLDILAEALLRWARGR